MKLIPKPCPYCGDIVFNKEMRNNSEVIPIRKSDASPMIAKHYLKKWPAVNVAIYGLIYQNEIVGVCVYSIPPMQTFKRFNGLTWELSRLWVDDKMPKNVETFFISQTIKLIKKHRPDVKCLVSYADPEFNHRGTIYKAANWRYDGLTDEGRKARFKYLADNKEIGRAAHAKPGQIITKVRRTPKHRFYYPL